MREVDEQLEQKTVVTSDEEVSVEQLMAEVEAAASRLASELPTFARVIRRQMEREPIDASMDAWRRAQSDANAVFSEIRPEYADPSAQRPLQGSRDAAANIASAARARRNPRQWARALKSLMLFQGDFDREVVELFDSHATALHHQFAMEARLMGAINALAAHLEQVQFRMAASITRIPELAETMGRSIAEQASQWQAELDELARATNVLRADIQGSIAAASAENRALLGQIRIVQQWQQKHESALDTLRVQIDDLAASIPTFETVESGPVRPTFREIPQSLDAAPQIDFLAFEGETRGGEHHIRGEQEKYLPWFANSENVLDAGCGRGEFLELLRGAGIGAYGIDTDAQMVTHCQRKGLRVMQGDLVSHLEQLEDESIGGLFLGQVVEHMTPAVIAKICQLAIRKLQPGKSAVIETINPTCLTTFSGAFYADPTHVRPVHPNALQFLMHAAGFGEVSFIYSAPIPENEKLTPIRESAPVDSTMKDLILQMNRNIERLNSVMYSYANYAAAARKSVNGGQE